MCYYVLIASAFRFNTEGLSSPLVFILMRRKDALDRRLEMFEPVFVFDSHNPSIFKLTAERRGFRMVDIREVGASVHGGNPAVVVYDTSADAHTLDTMSEPKRFLPPKSTGIMILFGNGMRGHVRGLPDRTDFILWWYESEEAKDGVTIRYFNPLTGNFRISG